MFSTRMKARVAISSSWPLILVVPLPEKGGFLYGKLEPIIKRNLYLWSYMLMGPG